MDTSPPDVPASTLFAPFVPLTTPVLCTDAPTLPALEVATLRLLLAVVLSHHRDVPSAKAPTLRLTGIVTPARLCPLSRVAPLPKGSFPRRPQAT